MEKINKIRFLPQHPAARYKAMDEEQKTLRPFFLADQHIFLSLKYYILLIKSFKFLLKNVKIYDIIKLEINLEVFYMFFKKKKKENVEEVKKVEAKNAAPQEEIKPAPAKAEKLPKEEKQEKPATKSSAAKKETEAKPAVKAKEEAKPAAKSEEKAKPAAKVADKKASDKPAPKDEAKIEDLGSAKEELTKESTAFAGKFEIKKSKDDRYVFNLYAANSVIVATSQVYSSSAAAQNGIKSVIENASKAPTEDQTLKSFEKLPFPKWEIYQDKGGQYRFRLSASNGSCICHSQGYTSKASCKNGIESIKKTAQNAKIDKSYLKKD